MREIADVAALAFLYSQIMFYARSIFNTKGEGVKQGYIQNEQVGFSGLDMVRATHYNAALRISRTTRVGSKDYYFEGYRTSIVSWLRDHGDRHFYIDDHYKTISPGKIMVHISTLMPGATEQVTDHILSGVGGVFGGSSVVATYTSPPDGTIGMIQSGIGAALDGKTIFERAGGQAVLDNSVAKSKPSKLTRLMDKALNSRIRVKVGCDYNTRNTAAEVVPTDLNILTCSQLATILRA